jgi:hypothetical protein
MLRKCLFTFVMLMLCITFVAAEEIKGKIIKIDDKSVTVVTSKKDKDGKAYTLAEKCKFCKMVKENKEELSGGVKADVFKDIDAVKGFTATITTGDDGKVTEIVLTAKKKKAAN